MPEPSVKRHIKIITDQKQMHGSLDKPSGVEGFPLRKWSIQIVLLNQEGEEIPATIFSKATYNLHESFGERAKQTFTAPPFKISEEGWGEFDMSITLTAIDKGGEHTIIHDLNFQSNRYEAKHPITFKNPKPGLLAALRESGNLPGDDAGRKKGEDSARKKKRADRGVNMDRLADNLQRLQEDDLLHVVQLIHDYKSTDSYTKNDVDAGEFHVDLYTLPDNLVEMLWTYSEDKVR